MFSPASTPCRAVDAGSGVALPRFATVTTPSPRPVLLAALGVLALSSVLPDAVAAPDRRPAPAAVHADAQTRAFVDDASGRPANADADDPAIWVDRDHPSRSIVLGTLKEGGLAAFDLRARTLQILPAPPAPSEEAAPGRYNNVDVVGDLAVVSDRGRDRIRVFRIDPRGAAAGARVLTEVTDGSAAPVFSADEAAVEDQRTAYGLAAARDPRSGVRWVAVTRRHEAQVALLALTHPGSDAVGTRRLDTLDLPDTFTLPDGSDWSPCEDPGEGPQLEGSVIDARRRVLYTAQEDVGIWRVPLTAGGFGRPRLIEKVTSFGVPATYDEQSEECVVAGEDPGYGGRWLVADAEGLALAGRTLLASSQGDSRFVLFGAHRTRDLRVVAGGGLDSVEHSDGSAISTADLGPRYPHGLLVVHDGERTPAATDAEGEELATTGFAFVPLQRVLRVLGTPAAARR